MARAMVDALKAAGAERAQVQRLASTLTGSVPMLVDGLVQEDRRSRSLWALLSSLTGHNGFGEVQFLTLAAADDPWASEELRLIEDLNAQLKGGRNA